MKSPLSRLIKDLWHKTLSDSSVHFIKRASVIKYLVAKEYPSASDDVINFTVNRDAIEMMGLNVFFASAIHLSDDNYQTLKTSRVMAIGADSDMISDAAERVNLAIDRYVKGNLEYRRDIGSKESLQKLKNIASSMRWPKDQ